ncbi:DsbA family protein [Patulibacter defluvii]|uniref:DsbA family protein n=1 Tax=Patulibacter defluvii TaxID=3095358 RepID=UPI002A754154|nr:DsbA family protein [Patulibacter sp. DM4]
MTTPQAQPQVLVVLDAYCGWCHGFRDALLGFWERHREDHQFVVLAGGLITGERVAPIGTFDFIPDGNRRIAELTGARFGQPYLDVLAEGSLVLDSTDAARGFTALRDQAPERAVPLAVAIADAFFHDGRSLSDVETFRAVATAEGLDPDAAAATFADPATAGRVVEEFATVARIGVSGFPTVAVSHGDHLHAIAVGYASGEDLEQRLAAADQAH